MSIPAGISVVALARTETARAAVMVYALSLSGLYAASAAFHTIRWSPKVWAWMRKLDHSMIYMFIAGSYTPIALLALRPPWSTNVLAIVWGGAAIGVALKLFVRGFAALAQVLYMTLGWLAIFILPQLVATMSSLAIALLFGGGVLYTAGAVVFDQEGVRAAASARQLEQRVGAQQARPGVAQPLGRPVVVEAQLRGAGPFRRFDIELALPAKERLAEEGAAVVLGDILDAEGFDPPAADQGEAAYRGFLFADIAGQVFGSQYGLIGKGDGLFDSIFELANISGPGMGT